MDKFLLNTLLPFNIALEFVVIKIKEMTIAAKMIECILFGSIISARRLPTTTPNSTGIEINSDLDQMRSFDFWKL
jgi:hypothetical protein